MGVWDISPLELADQDFATLAIVAVVLIVWGGAALFRAFATLMNSVADVRRARSEMAESSAKLADAMTTLKTEVTAVHEEVEAARTGIDAHEARAHERYTELGGTVKNMVATVEAVKDAVVDDDDTAMNRLDGLQRAFAEARVVLDEVPRRVQRAVNILETTQTDLVDSLGKLKSELRSAFQTEGGANKLDQILVLVEALPEKVRAADITPAEPSGGQGPDPVPVSTPEVVQGNGG